MPPLSRLFVGQRWWLTHRRWLLLLLGFAAIEAVYVFVVSAG